MGFSRQWINGALLAATSVALAYWFTWRSDQILDARKLLIIGIVTFLATFVADLAGDEIINYLEGR